MHIVSNKTKIPSPELKVTVWLKRTVWSDLKPSVLKEQ